MLQRVIGESGPVFYVSPLLHAADVPHAFGTRIGGVSKAPFDSLNMANPSGVSRVDSDTSIAENYRLLLQDAGLSNRRRCWVHQVHGDAVIVLRPDEPFEDGARADALVTRDPSRVLSIKTADCVPILLATRDGECVSAIHAGWRGVIARVVLRALDALCAEANAQGADVLAAIGPCIGPGAFEVGPEVAQAFTDAFTPPPVRPLDGEKSTVDLPSAVLRQLIDAGVTAHHIDQTDRCTFTHADEFFSHRRDNGLTGRMAALIAPRAADAQPRP